MAPQANDGQLAEKRRASDARGDAKQRVVVKIDWTQEGSQHLKELMTEREGCPLKAWIKFFDKNVNGIVTKEEFMTGMARLSYTGDAEGLWQDIDLEDLGEITLSDISSDEARLFSSFRKFCGARVDSSKDFINVCKRGSPFKPGNASENDFLVWNEFREGITRLGWEEGFVERLFNALDSESEGCVTLRSVRWMDADVRRRKIKEEAKGRSKREAGAKAMAKAASRLALQDFKAFLKRSFASLYHAWRKVLDVDGTMSLQKAELFKACRQLNWKGDVRALWRALDFDSSGATSIDELDPQTAQTLAYFKDWADTSFGLKPSAAMWKNIDPRHRGKLTHQQFIHECQSHGFDRKLKQITSWLDWQGKQCVTEADLKFLDIWRPPPWILAKPNLEAANFFKRQMLKRFQCYLKGWRMLLDQDNSNCCSWHEFVRAAQALKFNGDVPGAWLALDADMSGSISLKEIDADVHDTLMNFKSWAVEEFGGVRNAFEAMDSDRSNELSFVEFRRALRNFGFPGGLPRVSSLFNCLDMQGEKLLQVKEIDFLDDWELPHEARSSIMELSESVLDSTEIKESQSILLDYVTDNPGPGAYEVRSGLGSTPGMPMIRHGGAFSMRRRGGDIPTWMTANQGSTTLGPGQYTLDDKASAMRRRKPAWGFPSTPRPAMPASSAASGLRERRSATPSPGPGTYEAKSAFEGPKFSMGSRWGLRVHPRQQARVTSPRTMVATERYKISYA